MQEAKKFRRIGVLTSGGDAPGMNAAVRAVTRTALARGVEVMGIYNGYNGLINGDMKLLDARDVSDILQRGGTMLYTARCLDFKTEEGLARAIEACRESKIDGIVACGGDGTFRGALDLTRRGIPCVAIPCTIDNDISSTDYSIGYDTAVNTVIQMVDRLTDTCQSHLRCSVVEVMGRAAGHIAADTGTATGACAIAVGELPVDMDKIVARVNACKEAGRHHFIVMVSEGAGITKELTAKIEKETGIETRATVLGHVQRGGTPTVRDRVIATRMGHKAVDLLLEGRSNLVVAMRKDEITAVDIEEALRMTKSVDRSLIEMNEEISF